MYMSLVQHFGWTFGWMVGLEQISRTNEREDGRTSLQKLHKTFRYFDAYCMDVTPLNIFENQVIPIGLHEVLGLIWLRQESFVGNEIYR